MSKSSQKPVGKKPGSPSRLGRGLSSLMNQPVPVQPETGSAPTSGTSPVAPVAAEGSPPTTGLHYIAIDQVVPNPHQPRQIIRQDDLRSLATSIEADGLIQPVVVRPPQEKGGPYILVAGERRWRAAQLAQLTMIPALVRDITETQAAELALIENLQREDLNPMDKAEAFLHLADTFKLTHEAIAERMAMDRASVSNLIRLTQLDANVQQLIRDGLLSMGQARAILAVHGGREQLAIAKQAIARQLSVRQVEQLVRSMGNENAPAAAKGKTANAKSPGQMADLENQIARQLGTKVHLRPGRRKGSGSLQIEFYSLEAFDALMERLGVTLED